MRLFSVFLHPLLVGAYGILPRQITSAPTPTSTDCSALFSSLNSDQPRLASEYSSWQSSVWATITDNCTGVTVPSSLATYFTEWRSSLRDWSASHATELRSLSSQCSDFISSRVSSFEAWNDARRSSCRSVKSTASRGSTSSATTTTGSAGTPDAGASTPTPTTGQTTVPPNGAPNVMVSFGALAGAVLVGVLFL